MKGPVHLWKVIILAGALPVLDCTAAKRPSLPATGGGRGRRGSSTETTTMYATRAGAARRRAHENTDDFADWSGGGSSDNGGVDDDFDDDDDGNSDYDSGAWVNSYDDEEEDDTFPASGGGGGGGGLSRGGYRPSSPPSSDLDLEYDGSDSYDSQGEEKQGFWSDGEGYDDHDSYEYSVPTRSRQRGPARRAPSPRRPRPSAWTGDGDGGNVNNGGGRRRQSGRTVPLRGRSGSRSSSSTTVARYDRRGRRVAPPTRGFAVRMPAVNGAAIASALRRQVGTAKEAMGQAGSLASSTSRKLKREVKLAVSGSWESALLKVTWPDDSPPDETLVYSLVDAVQAFKKDRDVTKNSAEHRVLLRKLWAKMSEHDWRTVSKAIYLFHSILMDLSSEHHAILKIFLGKMSREWDKKTGCRYFDLDVLCAVSEEGDAFRSFVDRYGTYVFKRAEGFNARFQELDSMRDEEGWEHVVTTLAKAQKAIDLGVSCQPEPEEETELTVLCLRNTVTDVHELWRRFHSALAWVLAEADDGDLFGDVDSSVLSECLDEFKHFYTSRYEDVSAFLLEAEELLGIYGLDVGDLDLPAAHTFDDASAAANMTTGIGGAESDDDDDDDVAVSEKKEKDTEPSSPAVDAAAASAAARRKPAERAKARKATVSVKTGSSPTGGGGSTGIGGSGVSDAASQAEAGTENHRDGPGGKRATGGRSDGEGGKAGTGAQQPAPGGGGVGVGLEAARETGVVDVEDKSCDVDASRDDDDDDSSSSEGGGEEEEEEEEEEEDDGDSSGAGQEEEGSEDDDEDDDDDDDEEEEEEEEEDSAEEGAVDENVEDLTYFDDATQPDRSSSSSNDGDWDR